MIRRDIHTADYEADYDDYHQDWIVFPPPNDWKPWSLIVSDPGGFRVRGTQRLYRTLDCAARAAIGKPRRRGVIERLGSPRNTTPASRR